MSSAEAIVLRLNFDGNALQEATLRALWHTSIVENDPVGWNRRETPLRAHEEQVECHPCLDNGDCMNIQRQAGGPEVPSVQTVNRILFSLEEFNISFHV